MGGVDIRLNVWMETDGELHHHSVLIGTFQGDVVPMVIEGLAARKLAKAFNVPGEIGVVDVVTLGIDVQVARTLTYDVTEPAMITTSP
jgi:hypothetical protein